MRFLAIAIAIGPSKRWGRAIREALQAYVKCGGELAEHVRGNEQATKQSLIGPLFTILGDDLTDPRECIPEYRVDFGPNRSVKPIDWAFLQTGHPIFFVEARQEPKIRLDGHCRRVGAPGPTPGVDAELGLAGGSKAGNSPERVA